MITKGTSLQFLLVVACSQICSSLFYTNSRENDYPRIGKRLELYQVLKGETSYPKYLDTNKQEQDRTKALGSGIPGRSWGINEKVSTLFGRSERDKTFGIQLPVLFEVQRERAGIKENRRGADDMDEVMELFKKLDPDFDDIL